MGRRLGWIGVCFCLLSLSCGGEFEEELRQVEVELRPTDVEDPSGYEGAETDTLVSPGGHVRVWFATEGAHRAPGADEDENGVPDYVEMVAEIGDEVAEFLVSEGWRLPLTDSLLATGEPLDLYLVDFEAGDGNYRVDACGVVNGSEVCRGHLRIDNDFSPLYYPSVEYALRVVISHEYFHGVQAAYGQFDGWWSEGSATWFQERFWAEQSDFERLTQPYFDEPERSLIDRQRGPFDSFAYGASMFVYFLEVVWGAEVVREVHENVSVDVDVLQSLEMVLGEVASSLEESFELFAAWNVFTGSRAVEGEGYPEADRFGEVGFMEIDGDRSVDWNVSVDALAVKYGRIDGSRGISISAGDIEGFGGATLQVVGVGEFGESGVVHVVGEEPVVFGAEEMPVFVVVANGDVGEERAVQVRLRGEGAAGGLDEDEVDEVDDGGEVDGGGGGCGVVPGLPGWGWLLVVGVGLVWRRRRR